MNFYTYYSYEDWGRGYIGSRQCLCAPEDDVSYFGSFSDTTFCPTNKVILGVHSSNEERLKEEERLQRFFDVVKNPHFVNRSIQTSTSFSTSGLKMSETFRENCRQRMTGVTRSEKSRRVTSTLMLEQNPMKNPQTVQKCIANRRSYAGSLNPNSKLSDQDRFVIKLLKKQGVKLQDIADSYNVSYSTIKRVK